MMKQFCLLLILVVCACEKNVKVDCISFELGSDTQDIHATNLLKECKLIPLESRDSILIGKIDKAIFWKDKIYVATFRGIPNVYAYDSQGHFLSKVGNNGRGPEEFLQLCDLFVDSIRGTLNILSRIDQKLLEYDLNDFHLVKVRRLPKSFCNLFPWKDGYVGYMGNYTQHKKEPSNLWIMDSTLKIVDRTIKINNGWESKMPDIRPLSVYNDSIYYITPTDFNIYRYVDGMTDISHKVNFGRFHIPKEKGSYEDYRNYNRLQNYVTTLEAFQELPDYYLYEIVVNGQTRLCLYHKNTGKRIVCELSAYTGKYFLPFGNIIDITSQGIITYIEAVRMHDLLKGSNGFVDYEKDYPEQIRRMRNELPEIEEDSNPCIVLWTF